MSSLLCERVRGACLGVELPDRTINLWSTFRGDTALLSAVAVPFPVPITHAWAFPFPHIPVDTCYCPMVIVVTGPSDIPCVSPPPTHHLAPLQPPLPRGPWYHRGLLISGLTSSGLRVSRGPPMSFLGLPQVPAETSELLTHLAGMWVPSHGPRTCSFLCLSLSLPTCKTRYRIR